MDCSSGIRQEHVSEKVSPQDTARDGQKVRPRVKLHGGYLIRKEV